MRFDSVKLHCLWRETTNRLDSLARSVREHKSVAEASNFAKWLQFSGVIDLLEQNPQGFPLVVDGKRVREQVRTLLSDCGESFRNGKADPKYAASDIAEINRKLDILAAHVATNLPPEPALADTPAVDGSPALRVIAGGLSVEES